MPLEPGFLFTEEAVQIAERIQGARKALQEVRNRGNENASPLKTVQLGTCPNKSPTRLSTIVYGGRLGPAGCDALSSYARPAGDELLISSTVPLNT